VETVAGEKPNPFLFSRSFKHDDRCVSSTSSMKIRCLLGFFTRADETISIAGFSLYDEKKRRPKTTFSNYIIRRYCRRNILFCRVAHYVRPKSQNLPRVLFHEKKKKNVPVRSIRNTFFMHSFYLNLILSSLAYEMLKYTNVRRRNKTIIIIIIIIIVMVKSLVVCLFSFFNVFNYRSSS